MISETEKQRLRIGFKQTVKAVNENRAEKVFVAADAEDRFSMSVCGACEKNNVPVVSVPAMRELGKMCGIDVGASCAVILK